MEWLWQFFYTLLPSKYPPMALSTLKTFLGGNSSDTLFFFLYLEIFGWEQLKKAPCKWSKSWWKRPKKVGQGLQSPLLSNARKKVFLWGGVSLYCNIWNTTYFTRQSNGRCSSKSRFRLHIVQGLRTKEISPTSPLRFVLITCISFSNINHILLRKNLFSSRMSRCN